LPSGSVSPTGSVINPDLIGITFATTITLVAGATSTDQNTAIGQASAAAMQYINNLGVGNPLIINDIAADRADFGKNKFAL